jgi:hypothetical protein
MDTLTQAQSDMRNGYCSGGAGILASSLAWSAAAATAALVSPERSVWVLLIGGMLIHPAAMLICRLLGATGRHTAGNPLAVLAAASTFWLIFSLPLAYGLSLQNLAWFFPAMLLVIGGRYLVFATMFGMRLYWVLGLALAAAGFALGRSGASPLVGAAAGAAIEMAFAAACLVLHRRWTLTTSVETPRGPDPMTPVEART